MAIIYQRETISAQDFADILHRSGLAARRPATDLARLQRMIEGASLIVTARDKATGQLVGLSRALTDFSYACYLSDLAVDEAYKSQGIGTKLIETTQACAGEDSMCLLIAAPAAVAFYEKIGMPRCDRAFMTPSQR